MSTFSADFRKMLQRAGDKADNVVRKSFMDIWASIDAKSPVGDPSKWENPKAAPAGYTGGNFRANWNASINTPDLSVDGSTDFSRTKEFAMVAAKNYKTGDTLYLTNSLPYAARLEYAGWSKKQAPLGMVRITAQEFESYVKRNAQ